MHVCRADFIVLIEHLTNLILFNWELLVRLIIFIKKWDLLLLSQHDTWFITMDVHIVCFPSTVSLKSFLSRQVQTKCISQFICKNFHYATKTSGTSAHMCVWIYIFSAAMFLLTRQAGNNPRDPDPLGSQRVRVQFIGNWRVMIWLIANFLRNMHN